VDEQEHSSTRCRTDRPWARDKRTHGWKAAARDGVQLQANCKTLEGASHPDRNAQFELICDAVEAQLSAGNPVISVKKKELVGDFKNVG